MKGHELYKSKKIYITISITMRTRSSFSSGSFSCCVHYLCIRAAVCKGARENGARAGREEARGGAEEAERRRVEEEKQKAGKKGY